MPKNKKEECNCGCNKWHHHPYHKAGGAVYGLGFIGAAVYYISHATTFWLGFIGFLKALVWPAFLVFNAMKFFGM